MSRNNDDRRGTGAIGGRGLSGALGGGLARLEREERRAASAGATQGRAHLGLRLSLMSGLVVTLMCVLLVRLWTVQVIDHHQYSNGAQQELYTSVFTPAPRGEIVASGGQVLATDTSDEVVTMEPAEGSNGKQLVWVAAHPVGEANLSALLGMPESRIDAELNSLQNVPHQPVVVAIGPQDGVTQQAVVQISEHPNRYPGIKVVSEYVRDYPEGALAAQILGYTGTYPATIGYTAAGKARSSPLDESEASRYPGIEPTFGEQGLEQQYQRYLFGAPGSQKDAVDPSGDVLAVVSTKPAVQGDTVVLNMNLGLERSLCGDLANQLATLRSGSPGNLPVPAPDAAAVVLDVHTGAVLAICSDPSYNDNDWVGGISLAQYQRLEHAYGSPLNDYAVADPQPPGSDFKIASATAALADGLISPYWYFDDTGTYTVGSTTLHDNEDDGVLEVPGPVDITEAITQSSDDFFYNVGNLFWQAYTSDPKSYPYGPTPIQDVAHEYGLGVEDGIDLPAEDVATGQVDSPAWRAETGQQTPWQAGDNMEMAFGQGETEITPLELATAYATFADGGVRHAPELASEIVSPSGRLVERIAPRVVGHVDYGSSANYQAILAGFEGVTQDKTGTGYQAFQGFDFSRWNVAGKTGTATTNDAQPTSWFVAFGGPRSQGSQYCVAVQVNQGGYGATASAPIAREVFDYLYHHRILPASGRS